MNRTHNKIVECEIDGCSSCDYFPMITALAALSQHIGEDTSSPCLSLPSVHGSSGNYSYKVEVIQTSELGSTNKHERVSHKLAV